MPGSGSPAGTAASRPRSGWSTASIPTPAGPGTRSASGPAPGTSPPDAPEAQKGFLLNHLIDELLPEREGGYRYANADPVTGQAAWYDLRVRIEPATAAEAGTCAPQLAALCPPPGLPPAPKVSALRHRVPQAPMTSLPRQPTGAAPRPGHRPRHLRRLPGLRRPLQGVEHRRPSGAAHRPGPLRRERARRLAEPGARLRGGRGRGRPDRAFPEILPALRGRRLRHGLPDRGLLQAGRGRHRAGRRGALHRLRPVRLGLSLRRARARRRSGRDEEMHALHRPDLQREPRRDRPRAGLRAHLSRERPPFRRSRRSRVRGSRAWSPSAAATT